MSIRSDLQAFYNATRDVRFLDAIAALDHWGIEKKRAGAPDKWRPSDLIRLWAWVQAIVYDGNTIGNACRVLAKGDGFWYQEDGREKVAITNHRRLNRLYNDAAAFVSGDPGAKEEAEKQKRQFIFERHPDNQEIAKQVREDNIAAARVRMKYFREQSEKNQRAKNRG